ncbi:hypothetical protein [Lysinibacillus sphaericus]|nr:hypothetical protein [Lysinibacillus sp. SDF0037]
MSLFYAQNQRRKRKMEKQLLTAEEILSLIVQTQAEYGQSKT